MQWHLCGECSVLHCTSLHTAQSRTTQQLTSQNTIVSNTLSFHSVGLHHCIAYIFLLYHLKFELWTEHLSHFFFLCISTVVLLGMSVGLQQSLQNTWSLFLAVMCHETVIGFSLGLQLVKSRLGVRRLLITSLVCSIIMPIGVAAGRNLKYYNLLY